MCTLTVEPVATRAARREFLELPWRLYHGDPRWVPPLRREQAELVGYRPHPFYQQNAAQTFLVFRGREVCGRIAAIDNRIHNDYHAERVGFFGFFECIDDVEAAAGLFDAAERWLAGRGLRAMRGPASPSINYTIGTLIDGFDRPPAMMMPYNPPYHARLIESCGFRKIQDLYAYYGHRRQLDAVKQRLDPVADQIAERYAIRIRHMRRWRLRRDLRAFLGVLNRSLSGHWGFVPFSEGELGRMARGLAWLLLPELAVGAEIDGRLVGVVLLLPDYAERIRRIDGRLLPLGWLRLLWRKRSIRRYRLVAANVVPEFQLHGVSMVLMKHLGILASRYGAEEVEIGWIAESNRLSYGSLEKGGAERAKTYRVYQRDIAG